MALLLMGGWSQRAFDLVVEITKQVLTLSTAVIVLSVTFLAGVVGGENLWTKIFLTVSWVLFVVAVIAGIMTLMAAAGIQRDAQEDDARSPTIDAPNLRFLGKVQLLSFAVGLIIMLVVAAIRIF